MGKTGPAPEVSWSTGASNSRQGNLHGLTISWPKHDETSVSYFILSMGRDGIRWLPRILSFCIHPRVVLTMAGSLLSQGRGPVYIIVTWIETSIALALYVVRARHASVVRKVGVNSRFTIRWDFIWATLAIVRGSEAFERYDHF